jgi:hypothetical protein
MQQYLNLLDRILEEGVEKETVPALVQEVCLGIK